MKALSFRQPWAWLIINGHKDIENRDWPTGFRSRVLVHASKSGTKREYEEAVDFAADLGVFVPPKADLDLGGVVGAIDIVDCVEQHSSDWFVGPYGFVLRNPNTCPFIPYRGKLKFFDVPGRLVLAALKNHNA